MRELKVDIASVAEWVSGLPRYIAIYDISRYFILIAIRAIYLCHIAIQMCTGIDGVARG